MADNDKPIKKTDLGAIAFAKVQKLEKRIVELEKIINHIVPKVSPIN